MACGKIARPSETRSRREFEETVAQSVSELTLEMFLPPIPLPTKVRSRQIGAGKRQLVPTITANDKEGA